MSQELATTPATQQEAALAILGGSGFEGAENYVASAGYFTTVWKKSGDDAQAAAKAQGLDPSGNNVLFGITRGGLFTFINPFNFYLLRQKPVFSVVDGNGKSIRQVAEVPPGDPEADKFKEGFIALGAALQGETLVPFVATPGRFQGAMSKPIKQARLAVQAVSGSQTVVAAKGAAYAIAASIKAVPFRVQFLLGATVEKNDAGQPYPKGGVSQRAINQDDLDIIEMNEIFNPASSFNKDLIECNKVYDMLEARINKGWVAEEGD